MTVGKWCNCYGELGLEGLHDELRPGRPRSHEDDKMVELINRAPQTRPPDGSTRWSARPLAVETGISKSKGHRRLQTLLGPAPPAEIAPLRGTLRAPSSPPIRSLWRRFTTSLACT
jgi:hypothetical protein